MGEVLQDLHVADREAFRIAGVAEHDRELLVLDPCARSAPQTPLLDDHTPLLVDLIGLEAHQVSPVLKDLERGGDDLGIVGRHLEHVDGLIKARVRVDRRSELHADRFEVVSEVLLLEVLGAVKRHMLHQVGETALGVVLEHGARIHDEPQLGAIFGSAVLADQVLHAVVELAHGDTGVYGQRLTHRNLGVGTEGDCPDEG